MRCIQEHKKLVHKPWTPPPPPRTPPQTPPLAPLPLPRDSTKIPIHVQLQKIAHKITRTKKQRNTSHMDLFSRSKMHSVQDKSRTLYKLVK